MPRNIKRVWFNISESVQAELLQHLCGEPELSLCLRGLRLVRGYNITVLKANVKRTIHVARSYQCLLNLRTAYHCDLGGRLWYHVRIISICISRERDRDFCYRAWLTIHIDITVPESSLKPHPSLSTFIISRQMSINSDSDSRWRSPYTYAVPLRGCTRSASRYIYFSKGSLAHVLVRIFKTWCCLNVYIGFVYAFTFCFSRRHCWWEDKLGFNWSRHKSRWR